MVIGTAHGGIDGGAESSVGICEKDINLSIAKKLERQLEKEDIDITMTRTSEEGLKEHMFVSET